MIMNVQYREHVATVVPEQHPCCQESETNVEELERFTLSLHFAIKEVRIVEIVVLFLCYLI